jgi:hypothetical protein
MVFDRIQYAFLQQKRLLTDAADELKTPLIMMRLALAAARNIHLEVRFPGQPVVQEKRIGCSGHFERGKKNVLAVAALSGRLGGSCTAGPAA